MFLVSRLNMGYDAEEDRLRLACENAAGERVVLWLTQRLVRRLLEKLAAFGAPANRAVAIARAQPSTTDEAKSAKKCAPKEASPVDNSCRESFLVTRLRLRQSPAGVSLSLMDDDCAEVQLRLDHSDLARWQELLAACCQVAQWPVAGKPAGMLAREADVSLRPRLLH